MDQRHQNLNRRMRQGLRYYSLSLLGLVMILILVIGYKKLIAEEELFDENWFFKILTITGFLLTAFLLKREEKEVEK